VSKLLSAAALERYHRDGFYFPISVLTPAEALEYRRRLERAWRPITAAG
jgi:hypothetical protein